MRILYVAMKNDYGKPERGLSFEHYNFFDVLYHMGHEIIYFDFMSLIEKYGRQKTNRRLMEIAKDENPDLLFSILYQEEFDKSTIRAISRYDRLVTLNWFCDDHWRFDQYSRYWAPCFHWVVTTAQSVLPKYAGMNYLHVIKSQWACNHYLYRYLNLPLTYDVSFVGQPHGNRPQIIQALRKAGIHVQVWGQGWDSGRLSQEEMIRVFNQSRINLNLSNASRVENSSGRLAKIKSAVGGTLNTIPFGVHLKKAIKNVAQKGQKREFVDGVPVEPDQLEIYTEQIKGRNFEVPGCGGFMLSGPADNLEDYYLDGKEIAVFRNVDDLIQKIGYYLNNETERALIAYSGYQRTVQEHTYAKRFQEIFKIIGLEDKGIAQSAGSVLEIE